MERESKAFWLYVGCYVGLLAAAATPSPLYVVYQEEWGFPTSVVTLVFAIYALTLLVSLTFLGGVSDRWGRPATTGFGMLLLAASTACFFLADGVGWLLVARALQGLATGVAIGCISAALVDESGARVRLAAVANAVLPSCGLVIGALASGTVVQVASDPTAYVFLGQFAVIVVLAGLCLALDLHRPRPGLRAPSLKVAVMRVPASTRPEFVRTLVPMIAAWSQVGVMLALAGNLLDELGVTDPFIAGLAIAGSSGAAAVGGVALSRTSPTGGAIAGAALLCIGSLINVVALVALSAPTFLVGTTLSGFGVGASMTSVMQRISPLPRAAERAGVFAALNAVGYAALAGSALVTGLVSDLLGLGPTSIATNCVVAGLAAIAVFEIAARQAGTGDRAATGSATDAPAGPTQVTPDLS